jgi:hypothetical protein
MVLTVNLMLNEASAVPAKQYIYVFGNVLLKRRQHKHYRKTVHFFLSSTFSISESVLAETTNIQRFQPKQYKQYKKTALYEKPKYHKIKGIPLIHYYY